MKKKAAAAILCVAMSVVMAGCGGGNSASSNASESTTTVTGSKGDEYVVDKEAKTVETDSSKSDYEPYTITLNLERSGIGQNMEETFTSAPEKVIADGDQMADFFFDLGLEDHMAGFTRGACWSTVNEYPARDTVTKITDDGVNLSNASKEQILATGCDFMMGWDSLFSEDHFSKTIFPWISACRTVLFPTSLTAARIPRPLMIFIRITRCWAMFSVSRILQLSASRL